MYKSHTEIRIRSLLQRMQLLLLLLQLLLLCCVTCMNIFNILNTFLQFLYTNKMFIGILLEYAGK